ncbi:MAG: hypothetical protein K0U41_04755 [Gammaproteobacteria bacterium]|nr:hypothetical protein [Gammaproteobacteria bacterium]
MFGKNNDANNKNIHSADDLHRVIGQLTVERHFLARKLDVLLSATNEGELILLRQMDEQYLKTPHYGSRSYATWFKRQGVR